MRNLESGGADLGDQERISSFAPREPEFFDVSSAGFRPTLRPDRLPAHGAARAPDPR